MVLQMSQVFISPKRRSGFELKRILSSQKMVVVIFVPLLIVVRMQLNRWSVTPITDGYVPHCPGQGTTSSRALVFDKQGQVVAKAQTLLTQYYPQPGWVEQDPVEIWATQSGVLNEAIAKAGIDASMIAGIGITNQRETTIVWDRKTGLPVAPAIVWQCRRTADMVRQLEQDGYKEIIRAKTGLILDAYFSATKIRWILDHIEQGQARAEAGALMFGTVDSWLIYKLTGGRVHITDMTNASRTMLFNIHTRKWDPELLALFDIPEGMLPEVRSSSEIYGTTNIQGHEVSIAGVAGDQQAALFGQRCLTKGSVKNTYGTGCFLLMNTGTQPVDAHSGLLTTIGIALPDRVDYALEGSIFIGGALIQWLRDELGLIQASEDTEYFASKVTDTGGVYIVPAFSGLGTPYWDMEARGTIFGLTRGTNRNHLIRAALEAIAYQCVDVVRCMEQDSGMPVRVLRADGGASANDVLMQLQADLLDTEVVRPLMQETTALGAAYLAGLACGYWANLAAIAQLSGEEKSWQPQLSEMQRTNRLAGWHEAVQRTLGWKSPGSDLTK